MTGDLAEQCCVDSSKCRELKVTFWKRAEGQGKRDQRSYSEVKETGHALRLRKELVQKIKKHLLLLRH